MTNKFLRRYTDLTALIYLLEEQKLTLLDPISWDDSNDSHYLLVYKNQKRLKTLLVICFTQVKETYHHWRVFASGTSGVCVKFKRAQLLNEVEKCAGVKTRKVKYLTIKKNRKPPIDLLPFIKRHAFKDEVEYRVIYESSESVLSKKDISIPLSCIAKITLSPWMHKSLSNDVKKVLKGIKGCEHIEIVRSTLIGNDEWKAIGGFIRGN
jgi:hypothetical protein